MKAKILLSVMISTVLLLAPCAFAQGAGQNPLDQNALVRFQNALKQDGFDVNPGEVFIWDPTAAWCDNQAGVVNGSYTNIGRYLMLRVPKSAEQPQPIQDFKIREDEAIVLIGLTPPPEKYFGFYSWIATKVYPDGRKGIFSTLGDAVNNLTIKTIGPTPFNAPVALILTPDRNTDARIRAALRRAGYPEAIINTMVLPASMLNLGHGEAADELRIALRNAIWEDPDAGERYITEAPKTLHIYRVTPRIEASENPFSVPPLRVRGTGQTEMNLMNKLGQLRQGIIDDNPGLLATDIQSIPLCYEGYDLIQRAFPEGCGDTRDAFVLGAGYVPEWGPTDKITLADDEFLMVYGVNHVVTGKATYMGINVYASETAKVSIGNVFDEKLPGTARSYLRPDDPAADDLYAYKVSRNCGSEANCLQLAIQDCSRLTMDSNTVLGLLIRMYLEPATKAGAAMPEILYDRIIKFSPRGAGN